MYLNTETGEYPRFDQDLINIGWNPGQDLPSGWVHVIAEECPIIEENQDAILKLPENFDGVWIAKWDIFNLTEEQVISKRLNIPDPNKSIILENNI